MLHCLVPHNYIHNNPEPLRSLAAKSCVPLHNIQALFQNTHNWLKCNQLTETIKVCFKLTAKSVSGAKLRPAKWPASKMCAPGALGRLLRHLWKVGGAKKKKPGSGRWWHWWALSLLQVRRPWTFTVWQTQLIGAKCGALGASMTPGSFNLFCFQRASPSNMV